MGRFNIDLPGGSFVPAISQQSILWMSSMYNNPPGFRVFSRQGNTLTLEATPTGQPNMSYITSIQNLQVNAAGDHAGFGHYQGISNGQPVFTWYKKSGNSFIQDTISGLPAAASGIYGYGIGYSLDNQTAAITISNNLYVLKRNADTYVFDHVSGDVTTKSYGFTLAVSPNGKYILVPGKGGTTEYHIDVFKYDEAAKMYFKARTIYIENSKMVYRRISFSSSGEYVALVGNANTADIGAPICYLFALDEAQDALIQLASISSNSDYSEIYSADFLGDDFLALGFTGAYNVPTPTTERLKIYKIGVTGTLTEIAQPNDTPFITSVTGLKFVDSNNALVLVGGQQEAATNINGVSRFYARQITNISPAGGFVDPSTAHRFTWALSTDYEALFSAVPVSTEIQYRAKGETEYQSVTITGTQQHYDFPADTFTGLRRWEWQLLIAVANGSTVTVPWMEVFSADDLSTAIAVSPVDAFINVDADNTFIWQHVIDSGTETTGANLQFSYNGAAWEPLASVQGNVLSTIVPAFTMPPGSLRWRVQTLNSEGEAGAWSEPAALVGQGAPPLPTITEVTNSPNPVVHWTSVGQVAYQIQIFGEGVNVYDTGEVPGAAKHHTTTVYLQNGLYQVQLRVKGDETTWSNWATYELEIDVPPAPGPEITVTPIENGARITVIELPEDVIELLIVRDGVTIQRFPAETGAIFDDYSALGEVTYIVRAVMPGGIHADSAAYTLSVTVLGAVFAPVSNFADMVSLKKQERGQPVISRSKSLPSSKRHYVGRTYPVTTFSTFADEQYSLAYFTDSKDEWSALEGLLDRRETVLYRDCLGNKFYCTIGDYNHTQVDDIVKFTLTVSRVDFVEGIAGDVT